jgi:hypothetical protein
MMFEGNNHSRISVSLTALDSMNANVDINKVCQIMRQNFVTADSSV